VDSSRSGAVENKYFDAGKGFVKEVSVKCPLSYRVLIEMKHTG
jgi:hypothetical protein